MILGIFSVLIRSLSFALALIFGYELIGKLYKSECLLAARPDGTFDKSSTVVLQHSGFFFRRSIFRKHVLNYSNLNCNHSRCIGHTDSVNA